MPDQAAIERGIRFEEHVADISGGCLEPGSGNLWNRQGDVRSSLFVIQAKAERKRSWGQTRRELKEAIDQATGSGRPGALAVLDDDGEELFVARLSDVIAAFSSDVRLPAIPSRGEERRRLASLPALLREGLE